MRRIKKASCEAVIFAKNGKVQKIRINHFYFGSEAATTTDWPDTSDFGARRINFGAGPEVGRALYSDFITVNSIPFFFVLVCCRFHRLTCVTKVLSFN